MKGFAALLCAGALAAGAPATGQVVPEDSARTVQFELRDGDRVVATPTVRVLLGRPAAVSVGEYSLRLRMDRAVTDGAGPAPYVIRSTLYRMGGSGTLVGRPAVTVAEGEQTRVQVAGSALSLAVLVR